MVFLLNELSLHGQFADQSSFTKSLKTIMAMRQLLSNHHHEFQLKRGLGDSFVIGRSITFRRALSSLTPDQRRSVMSWITTTGKFWSDDVQHFEHDVFLVGDTDIVGSALAEASYLCYLGAQTPSISFYSELWNYTPVVVRVANHDQPVDNFWEKDTLNTYLMKSLPEPSSWEILEENSRKCFSEIRFLDDALSYLSREPFSRHVAKEVFRLLGVLNSIKANFDESGNPTESGEKMYHDYFVSASPRFSDSSDREIHKFRSELTFRNPVTKQMDLFCPWHGKIHSPQIRIHFTHPITARDDLYVAYIGPKITKG